MNKCVINPEFERCDVTGQVLKVDECKAIEYRNKFKSLFNCNTAILVIDPENGHIEDANQFALSFYGYSHDEMTKLTVYDINQLSDFEIRRLLREAERKEINHFIFPHLLKDGEKRIVKVYSTPIYDVGRNLLFSIIQDITEEERLAKANAYNEKLYHQLFENNQSGIVLMDLNTCIINANRKFRKLFDITVDIRNQKLTDVISDDEIKIESLMLTQIATSGYSHSINTQRKDRTGNVLDLNIQVLPVYMEGKMKSIFAIYNILDEPLSNSYKPIHDVQELHEKERLASLNHITQGLTHELNTPLGVCLSNMSFFEQEIQILEKKCQEIGHLDTTLGQHLNVFKEALALTYESLNVMRDRLGNLEILAEEIENKEHADARETLMDVIFQYQSKAEAKGVDLEYTMDHELYTSVGRSFLQHIYENLLDNALNHGFEEKENGKITVRGFQLLDDVVIEVYDNGSGISEAELRHVFDPYFTTHKQHMGKGLTFIYDVLNRFNIGTIDIESEEGVYTKAIVRLNK